MLRQRCRVKQLQKVHLVVELGRWRGPTGTSVSVAVMVVVSFGRSMPGMVKKAATPMSTLAGGDREPTLRGVYPRSQPRLTLLRSIGPRHPRAHLL